MNYLVETKAEYTSQLINIISPFIYDGIQSLYDEALKVSKENEELKIFQSFLKKIPSWNPLILDSEITRIFNESDCADLLPQLLNAVIKSNIMVLTNTPPEKKYTIKLPKDIDFKKFIHCAYIETAKTIYNNPYLFYHKYSLYDIKKNQRDAQDNIKIAINEAIRKLLPLQYILNEYLGEDTPSIAREQDFDKSVNEENKIILTKMINKQDLASDIINNSNIINDISKLKEMLKNDPLDSATITDTDSDINDINDINIPERKKINTLEINIPKINIPENNIPKINSPEKEPYILKKIQQNNQDEIEQITNNSESVAYYKNNNSKILDSFSNKSNIRSVFYSNEPFENLPNKNIKSVNTADVQNYLKDQEQTTMKLSDDPNINSIKNIKTDKFKNKYYQV
jgi:hypothetical protein